MNKYPNNPWCTRPKDSPMRPFCRCAECLKFEEFVNGKTTEQKELRKGTKGRE